ncbi:MAG: phosphate ABC transporter permease PstA [Ruminococcaceae bacterium]|nr:phosphate ABC transporter permease PstA [Oscillospiraceae bacterium]
MRRGIRHHIGSALLRFLVWSAAVMTLSVLGLLVAYILWKGVPNLQPRLFAWEYASENVSMMPALVNTLTLTSAALALAVPLSVGAAVYLVEYARRGSRMVHVIRLAAETLAGIPSIVYGLFGYLMFSRTLEVGYSMAAGILTVSIMVLPTILRTTEEALLSVPDAYREGSFGLGAGRLRTIWHVVLPSAVPGIAAGIIVAVGRIVGETAALIFTAGTAAQLAGLTSSGRTLAVHMYALWNEGLHMEEAYAAGVVLLLLVMGINAAAGAAARRYSGRKG